jgi:transposase
LGLWPDPTTGRRRRVYGFLVTLGYSRYAFLWLCLRQDLQTVLDGLEAAWRFFGGVPRRLVVDNLKAVVTRADRYAPTIARVFPEYLPRLRPRAQCLPRRPPRPLRRRHQAPAGAPSVPGR